MAGKSVYYKLDAIDDVTEIDRSNSVFAGPNQSGPAYSLLSYNATTGLLSGINHKYMGTSLDNLTYTYDTLARVATFSSIDGMATYGYDPTSQLTSAAYTTNSGGHQPANESYGFDNNGNRTSVNGTGTTVASNNEVTNDGTFTYTFDAEGNRLTRTRDSSAAANDHQVSYTWDTRNRLVEVRDFNNTGTLTEQINYTYDVYDHLIERVDDVIGGATTTVHDVWDGDNIVLAFNGSGAVTTRYFNGPNTSAYDQYFSTLAQEDVTSPSSPGATTWDLLDNEGTLRDVIDANSVVVDHLNYDSHGAVVYESAPTVSHIDGYAGGLYDPSTQLVYFIHRWYDPAATVWISADPAGFAAGDANLTRYVANNLPNLTDPSGLFSDYGNAKTGSTSKSFSKSTGNVFVFGFLGKGAFPDDPSTGLFQMLNGVRLKLRECKASPVTITGFLHDIDEATLDEQLDNWMKTAKPGASAHIFLIGHSYGGDRAISEATRLRNKLNKAGFAPKIHLIVMDAIVMGSWGTAQTKGPSVPLESFDDYYETADPDVPGMPIKGASNHDVTNGVRWLMLRPEYRNDRPHTAIDNLMANGVYCKTEKGNFKHLYDLVPILADKVIDASEDTDGDDH